jgi:polysaccharide biosynthesis transport protein
MELRYFFSVLSKRKWLLAAVMLAAASAAFVIVGRLPHKFKTSALLTTGIVEYQTIRVGEPNPFVQEFEIESKFANLTERMKARPVINALTKRLILHDLRATNGEEPYRKVDIAKLGFTQERVNEYLGVLESRADSLGVTDKDIEILFTARTIEKALGYDYETIREQLEMKREGKSDYLRIDYISEKAELTYYVAKTFVDEFLASYNNKKDQSESKSLVFYRNLSEIKKRVLDSLSNSQTNYAKANGLVAPLEQAQALVTQIKELEMARDEAIKQRVGFEKSVNVYGSQKDVYQDNYKGNYAENINNNERVKELDNQLLNLNNKLVDGGNLQDANLKRQIEEIKGRRVLVSKQIALTRADGTDPAITKQNDMFVRWADAQSNLVATTQHADALSKRVGDLYSKRAGLVNNNAEWSKYNRKIEDASAEYKSAIERQYQADVIKQSGQNESPMKVLEYPMYPYKAESNKRALISSFAGVGLGSLALVGLFLLTYFDRSLGSVFQYTKQTGLPLLSAVNNLNPKKFSNFDDFFKQNLVKKETEYFKESLRKIRHDIEASGAKSFLFTSLKDQEGKSFMVASLAYSFTLKSKKVLIIDTNFKNNTLTGLSVKPFADNPVTSSVQSSGNATRLNFGIDMPTVDIIGNQGGHNSPSELLSGVDFKRKIAELGATYDYIFLEASALNKYSDARELVDFVEKVVPVFDATTALSKVDDNSLEFLHSLNGKVLGGILNKANLRNLN